MSLTRIVKIDPLSPEESLLYEAADIVKAGGLVIIPTETVYGIAANMLNSKAIQRLYKIKDRQPSKPFSLHIDNREKVRDYTQDIPICGYKLIDKFWPGPLTLVFKSKDENTIGIRLPDHKIAYEVISRAQVPIVCPSANLAGRPSPTNFEEAISDLEGLVDLGIDAGATRLGIESTVVDLTTQPLRILREAAIKAKDIEEVAIRKTVLFVCTGNSCRSVIAEALLKKIFWERHRHDVEVLSAGITMLSGMAASDQAQEVLRKEGIDVSGHVSRQVTRSMIDKSDIILVMEKIHEAKVLSLAPEAKHRLFLLKEFARIQDNALDIEDPMGRDDAFYAQTFATIKEAVERVAEIL